MSETTPSQENSNVSPKAEAELPGKVHSVYPPHTADAVGGGASGVADVAHTNNAIVVEDSLDHADEDELVAGEVRIDPPEARTEPVEEGIRRQQAATANFVTLLLIWALVLSLPLYVGLKTLPHIFGTINPADAIIDGVFDKWFSIITPLAGTALGAYFVSARKPS